MRPASAPKRKLAAMAAVLVLFAGRTAVAQVTAAPLSTEGPWEAALPFLIYAGVPLALVLVTSFIKISVVLHFLRSGLGGRDVPSAVVITAFAAIVSAFIMAPVGTSMWTAAEMDGATTAPLEVAAAAERAYPPLDAWLQQHTGAGESALFQRLDTQSRGTAVRHAALKSIPGFLLTELREAFLIGFLVLLPFLVVDLVVANVLLSSGLQALAPATVSLPLKLLLFVLVDGWSLLTEGLILGYVT